MRSLNIFLAHATKEIKAVMGRMEVVMVHGQGQLFCRKTLGSGLGKKRAWWD